MAKAKFVSALRFKWLTPLYDFFIGVTMPGKSIKEALIKNTYLTDYANVLDFGCGTATLSIMAKEYRPLAKIKGIDIDKAILARAAEKIKRRNLNITLADYNGECLPFDDNCFDRIISCPVFHHLETPVKHKVLAELFRIIKTDGQLIIADFGRSDSWLQRLLFNLIRGLDGFKPTSANAKGLIPSLITDAGFVNPVIKQKFKTVFGEVHIFKAIKQ